VVGEDIEFVALVKVVLNVAGERVVGGENGVPGEVGAGYCGCNSIPAREPLGSRVA